MSKRPTINSKDLPFTSYLNQRLTFDILAALEGGFSRFTTRQTTTAGESESSSEAEGQLALGNAFALVGITLGSEGKHQRGQSESESKSETEELVHTPASLFARLRKDLGDKKLIREISAPNCLTEYELALGDFVEFEATLRRSPLVEALSKIKELMTVMTVIEDQSGNQSSTQKGKGNQKQRRSTTNRRQVDERGEQFTALLEALTKGGAEDLVAEWGNMRAVLTTERSYFSDPTMNDVIEGTFRIFGKATRVIPEGSSDRINLLRKTPFGTISGSSQMMTVPDNIKEQLGISASFDSEIGGPALQVIPLAIFV